MFRGGGTNLKILEYLASGLPVISTPHGRRGLGLISNEHFVEADGESFASALNKLASDAETRAKLSRNGRAFVADHYSWDAIASHAAECIAPLVEARIANRKKTIVLFNDFSVANPKSGGELRIYHLYRNLAQRHSVVHLCLNDNFLIQRQTLSEGFTEVSWPKTARHLAEESRVNSQFWVSASDIVASYMVTQDHLLVSLAEALSQLADVVIASHPYMQGLTATGHAKHHVYECHNFEFTLKSQTLADHPEGPQLVKIVRACEAEAIERSSFLISASDDDHTGLQSLAASSKAVYTVENGVMAPGNHFSINSLAAIRGIFQCRPVVVFIGSGHKPNVDSFEWILRTLAPAMADCWFVIIGSVCDAFEKRLMPPNVFPCGIVDEATKEVLFGVADVAINPVRSGSGSNLKLGDYFANGIPSVTTPFGARGYKIQHAREAIICELPEFKQNIRSLVREPQLQKQLAENARAFASRNLYWSVLARRLDRILDREVFSRGKKRLLVITYRFTHPPRGGAEAHLLELLRHIDRSGEYSIQVATFDIVDIHDQFHFSARCTHDPNADVPPDLMNTSVYRFETDALPDRARFNHCRTLHARWMQEFRQHALQHLDDYEFPVLLGGWYYPERTEQGLAIWSSELAHIFVRGAHSLNLQGHCPRGTKVTFFLDNSLLTEHQLHGDFYIELLVDQGSVLTIAVDPCLEPETDPRKLGIWVRSVDANTSAGKVVIRLDRDYKAFLKERDLEQYIDELIRTAESRPARLEDAFQAVRGPLSSDLEFWLAENASHYDLIFAQGVPFSTSVIAAEAGKKHGVPVVLMPHFHMEDEFYHWKLYYDALRQSDMVISFPKAAGKLFFDKIGCRSEYLPYGARLDESPSSGDDEAFVRLRQSSRPYVLVLGRKSSAKNYQSVIDAVREVNKVEKICDLLIIGRDEDGVPIDPADACYLGEQSRGIVLAALKQCLCLVTMSESESFGIVILEAWSQSRPVIVTSMSVAYSELVDDGQNGLLATKETVASKIAFLLDHPEEARRMGANGSRKAEKVFSWSAISHRLLALFRELIDTNTGRQPAHPDHTHQEAIPAL
jgi:glycosyltransferase involved in cell wall biosynthesis